MGKEGGIYLSEVAREKAILFVQLVIILCDIGFVRKNRPWQ